MYIGGGIGACENMKKIEPFLTDEKQYKVKKLVKVGGKM